MVSVNFYVCWVRRVLGRVTCPVVLKDFMGPSH